MVGNDHPTGNDGLLSEAQIADELGVSVSTLSEWRRRDTGPRCEQIDGRPAYRPADVAAWLGKAARRPTASPISNAGARASR
jgi:transcriptional regulator with XRE-family HTH domain